ncbi:MAG TPA: condensation domain-containing protein, partial [Polyangiaceae bacterium]|nr:condensation domain-containing protein [Polyangiaceae bacterium]
FFELGGDSIVALQVVSRAKRAGLVLAPRDVFEHSTLAELARVAQTGAPIEAAAGAAATRIPSGAGAAHDADGVPLLPSQRWFFEQAGEAGSHFNQSVLLELPASVELPRLERALAALVAAHPALLCRFQNAGGGWRQTLGGAPARLLESVDLGAEPEPLAALEREASRAQRGLDLERGPVFRALHVRLGDEDGDRLLLIAHHLVVDAVSWRVIVDDLEAAYNDPRAFAQRPAGASLGAAARALSERARGAELRAELPWYEAQLAGDDGGAGRDLPSRDPAASNTVADGRTLSARLSADETQKLLGAAGRAYRTQVSDLLLTALAETFCAWSEQPSLLLSLGVHGRNDVGVDVSRVVGWFAGTHPLRLTPRLGDRPASIKAIKEQLRAVPSQGAGYPALRWLSPSAGALGALERRAPARVGFNYFGSIPAASPGGLLRWSGDPRGEERSPATPRDTWFDVGVRVLGDSLEVSLRYGARLHDVSEASALLERYMAALRELLAHCLSPDAGGVTPSDFPLLRLTQAELDALDVPARNIEDIYPLSPMQQGMLVHTLVEQGSGIYVMQEHFRFDSAMDVDAFLSAWRAVAARHAPLRTSFAWQAEGKMMQIVQRRLPPPVEYLDWADQTPEQQQQSLEALVKTEQQSGFDLARAPLVRFRLIRFNPECFYFIKSYHHILIDGWCSSLLLVEFFERYRALTEGTRLELASPPPYRDFIAWLGRKDPAESAAYWRAELAGFTSRTPIPVVAPLALDAGVSRVAEEVLYLTAPETERLVRAAQHCRITPNTFAQGAWALVLSQYSGQREVLFGVTVAGRPAELEGVQDTIGLFINTIPLRTTLPEPAQGTPVGEWLTSLLRQNVTMRQHEHVPL